MVLFGLWLLASGAAQAQALPLWELQGTGNRIMILGSIHFLRADDYPLPRTIIEAYRAADVLVMEIDMDDLDPAATQATMARLAIDPQGRTLPQLLDTRTYRAVQSRAAALEIGIDRLNPFEPWYAAIVASQLQLQHLGFDASSGVDARITARAGRDHKEIRGLESLEYQLKTLDGLTAGAQRKFLLTTLDEAAEFADEMDDLIAAWKTGDTGTLEALMLDGMADQPELYQRILVNRNRNWARTIRELARQPDDVLIIVGTMHLIGRDSLLVMLEKSGYPARQMSR